MIIKTDKSTFAHYLEDASGMLGANAEKVYIPENRQEVCELLKECSDKKIPVTVAAGCTGVTGGCLAYGGVILSTEKFNKIGKLEDWKIRGLEDWKQQQQCIISSKTTTANDTELPRAKALAMTDNSQETATIKVGSGAIVNEIKKYVLSQGWMYAPDPTEKNATIGGNISTDASGGRGFKYGTTRKYINAIEIVFTDGSYANIRRGETFADDNGTVVLKTNKGEKILHLPKYNLPNIKNAAAYYNYKNADLIDIFIGHEGTLGVIISAELILIRPFEMLFGGIIFFDKKEKSWDFVKEIRELSENARKNNYTKNINAMSVEYFDRNALNLIKPYYPVIPENVDAGILFEQDCTKETYDVLTEKWIDIIEKYGINTDDVWFASNAAEQEEFRIFRHKIPECVNEIVKKNKIPKVGTDVAVPHDKLHEMIYFCKQKFNENKLFNLTFGHIGESHLHANIIAATQKEYECCKSLYLEIAKKAVELGGTVTAEHGIGKVKHHFLKAMLGKEGIEEMRKFKLSLDPANILGRGNMFEAV